ncbi:hypothetical protein CAC42_2156 [Sphaceloma murrayae]|uniref:Uncharacterized protein n=1 Tax=Sphaceloma murrayae TaxID=2082308 RepID=A0A2K1QIF6_9PEZI|nr:hypothetical protein CAC42_2156 [Sphaceloma murrayae]
MIAPSTPPTLAPPSPTESTYRFSLIPDFVGRAVHTLSPFPRSRQTKIAEVKHTRSWSSDMASGTVTPPPSYSETLAPLLTPMKFRRGPHSKSEDKAPLPPTSAPSTSEGIQWKFANQGLSLLNLASQESLPSPPTTSSHSLALDSSDSPFARQLYLHALTYLLRALPPSLTEEESTSLLASFPSSLLPSDPLPPTNPYSPSASDLAEEPNPFDPAFSSFPPPPAPAGWLQRLISSTILHICLVISFLLPILRRALAKAYRLNRDHRVSERVLASLVHSADAVGRSAWGLSSTLMALGEGRAGKYVERALLWGVRAVSGGVWDGVGEGMALFGLRDGAASPWPCTGPAAGWDLGPQPQAQAHAHAHPRRGEYAPTRSYEPTRLHARHQRSFSANWQDDAMVRQGQGPRAATATATATASALRQVSSNGSLRACYGAAAASGSVRARKPMRRQGTATGRCVR